MHKKFKEIAFFCNKVPKTSLNKGFAYSKLE